MKKLLMGLGAWSLIEGTALTFFPKEYLNLWKCEKAPPCWNEIMDRMLAKPEKFWRFIGLSEAVSGLLMISLSAKCWKKE